jgi:hypothetical protein
LDQLKQAANEKKFQRLNAAAIFNLCPGAQTSKTYFFLSAQRFLLRIITALKCIPCLDKRIAPCEAAARVCFG